MERRHNQIMLYKLLFIIFILSRVECLDKTWQWSNNYDNPSHWQGDQVPCPGQTVIIPQEIVYMTSSGAIGPVQLATGYVIQQREY